MADTPNFRKGIGKLSTDTIFYIYKITNLQNNKIKIKKLSNIFNLNTNSIRKIIKTYKELND